MSREILRLALRDMAREPAHVFCIFALIAGVLAPLLLLFAVKAGVTESLIGALRENPRMREIAIIGNHAFGEAELEALRSWPEVAFAAPEERSIARRLDVRPPDAPTFERMLLVSSDAGDPLLPDGATLGPGQVAVGASLAAQWDLKPGGVLDVRGRRGNPPTARLALQLEVAHVLPRGWLGGMSALVPAGFASEIEAFYDDYALPRYGVDEGRDLADRRPRYETFRVYARDIRDVEPLEQRIEAALAVRVNSRAAEIAPLLGLSRDVDLALNVLAACAAAGLGAALVALFWANVERKRLTLSVMALMGARPRDLALFPLAQAAAYALGGAALGCAIFVGGAAVFQALFADDVSAMQGAVAPVRAAPLLAVTGGLLALALVAAAAAARRAFAVDPAIAIRSGG